MENQLQKALEKIIVPQYSEMDHVEVEQLGSSKGFYRITYFLNTKMPLRQDYVQIMQESTTIWKMLSPEVIGDIIVDFKMVED